MDTEIITEPAIRSYIISTNFDRMVDDDVQLVDNADVFPVLPLMLRSAYSVRETSVIDRLPVVAMFVGVIDGNGDKSTVITLETVATLRTIVTSHKIADAIAPELLTSTLLDDIHAVPWLMLPPNLCLVEQSKGALKLMVKETDPVGGMLPLVFACSIDSF